MAAKDSPVVKLAAAQGRLWAIKLQSKGWKSLSKAQKAAARSAGIGVETSVVVPKTVRIVGGNPLNRRRAASEPGNAMRSMTITKQEYLGDIFADKMVHTLVLDPRNVRSFPTLSAMALNYNKYRFADCKIRYSPRVMDSDCGFTAIFLSDSSDPKPKNKLQMRAVQTQFETSASKPLLATLPIDKSVKHCRDCPTDDAKLVDCGAVHFAVDGEHDGRLGELFIEFTIVLSEPCYALSPVQQFSGNKHIKGPQYVDSVVSGVTQTLTFNAGGSFLVAFHGDPIDKVSGIGLEDAGQRGADGTDKSARVCEVEVPYAGSAIVLHYKTTTRCSIYISRL